MFGLTSSEGHLHGHHAQGGALQECLHQASLLLYSLRHRPQPRHAHRRAAVLQSGDWGLQDLDAGSPKLAMHPAVLSRGRLLQCIDQDALDRLTGDPPEDAIERVCNRQDKSYQLLICSCDKV